jgi:DNA mismatch repair protein MutS
MIKQYLSIKEEYPDAILFYRMGDFYEMFFEDAEIASKTLEIALTSRNKNDAQPIPMCGVPHRTARNYIGRLIENGFKVAVCDQVEDPATAKGLVQREVVRVITPGMIVEPDYLDERSNNFIAAVATEEAATGLAYLDISAGIFRATESNRTEAVIEEIQRLSPSEILLPEHTGEDVFFAELTRVCAETAITRLAERAFDRGSGYERLTEQFRTLSLEGFGCENLPAVIRAAGALVYYLRETQKQATDHLQGLETYRLEDFLLVDESSRRNLELVRNLRSGARRGSLLSILDRTMTAMGARLLKDWLLTPLTDLQPIRQRHDAVEEACRKLAVRRQLRESLKAVYDLERIGSKIVMGHANARDLLALKQSLFRLPEIWDSLSGLESELYRSPVNIHPLTTLAELVERSIRDDAPPTVNEGGIIKEEFSDELDDLVHISRDGKGWLARLEVQEREATGINVLKVRYNKVFGYYIEVPKSRSAAVPEHYVRKQTLVNAERYITDELKSFESKVLGAEEKRCLLEYELFKDIRRSAAAEHERLKRIAAFLAGVDCLLNLAEIADQNDYHRPEMSADGILLIEEGRHPVVEKMIAGERFVPNTVRMDNESNQMLIITGPNMAGKSTVLRQVALLVILSQMGSFIPARKAAMTIVDRIFTRVGALDNLSHGQSTFMVEMQETANILNHATPDSLVVMDEIGRGTSTFDGLSIAWAVAEHLHDLHGTGVKTLFATHYHELTALSKTRSRVQNYNIAVKEWNDEIIFLRKLVEGGTNRSYGIQVARLAGIPQSVVLRAKHILYQIENGEHRHIGSPAGSENEGGRRAERTPVQLDLFGAGGNAVLHQLRKLDIGNMTPLQALNFLDELLTSMKAGDN